MKSLRVKSPLGVSFGTLTFALAGTLAQGSLLARALCVFFAAFWTLRLVVATFVFDLSPYLTEFESPFGILGRLVDRLFLATYMRGFLVQRNRKLRELAESEEWRKYLGCG